MTLSAPINRNRLQEYSGGDIEFEQELLDLFVTDARQHLNRIEDAVNGMSSATGLQRSDISQTLEIIYEEAHQLKGASGNIGADAFQSIAAQLEQDAKQELAERCEHHLADLKRVFVDLTDQVQEWSKV
ncbi:hypothetical protein C1752_06362 [Acaryochloris thomasi RCC1774]|uniref:HPt domain-containing protein n=1 Tax=Acaryochloris thomasi RCC1774 TaxID=1764569 RepID=A0A2W1JBT9_9CYAN|nr:Hpt domain-containing protein [Acaryochloris thomasi]PZD71479.1 hypothetical protein C1752_06362 [Acaryochloris thomasi RCC1774]